MISWIKGEVITLWQSNNKFFVLINCQNVGYEIQVLQSVYSELNNNKKLNEIIVLWLKHIKKEDSDTLFGFISKDQKDFFNEILNIKGVGSQIGMALLNKFSIREIIDAINSKDKKLIGSVQGVGQKMTERIILELNSNLIANINKQNHNITHEFLDQNNELGSLLKDLEFTLQSLSYPKKEIKNIIFFIISDIKNGKILSQEPNNFTFENLLKQAMHYLDKKNSNLVQ